MDDATAITNLLAIYAERIDAGDLDGAARLFEHAEIQLGGGAVTDAAGLGEVWRSAMIIHADGTPRTRHLVTNPIIEIDGNRASCRSVYTVLQQVDDRPFEAIITGRYLDEFEKVDGSWRFSRRDYAQIDLIGDASRHLRPDFHPRPSTG
jgi:hypothetical protein